MFNIRMIQAEEGDCFLLEYGTPTKPRYILVDGGPDSIYPDHLKGELKKISKAGQGLDLVMISHVHNDHIIGILDWTAELKGIAKSKRMKIGALWHNSFDQTIGHGNDIEARLATAISNGGTAASVMSETRGSLLGIGEGHKLRADSAVLGITLNGGFPNALVTVNDGAQALEFGNLELLVVGPTQDNIEALRAEWLQWLDDHEDEIASGDPAVAAMADASVPNLSSIMVFAKADGKTVLLTGDGRGDHLLEGLAAAGLTDSNGGIDVDVLKVPHHGSNRNVTKGFFQKVRARTYLISSNGKDDNPDFSTLKWIVETADAAGRKIDLIATNKTDSIRKVQTDLPPGQHSYKLKVLSPARHSFTLKLA